MRSEYDFFFTPFHDWKSAMFPFLLVVFCSVVKVSLIFIYHLCCCGSVVSTWHVALFHIFPFCFLLTFFSGSLIQLPSVERGKLSKVRLGSLSLKKEGERQCFLFTKHFLICTRSSGGKLHLLKVRTCTQSKCNPRENDIYSTSHSKKNPNWI